MNDITTFTTVSDVRRGDVIVDGAGSRWTVRATRCPMGELGVYFTFEEGGEFRYLENDKIEVVA